MTTDKTPGLALFALIVVYTLNIIDRQIVGILAVPIKADFGLTDAQLGLMGGLAFALFYTGLGIPIAMLADRRDRTWIMTGALLIWSAMTALCGAAQNFWQLFLARLGVGIGEAGGVAPAFSLIADLYPPERRARALALFSFGVPIGSALGMVIGGVIATLIDWRYAFFLVGLAGIIVAPLFKMAVRDPGRGHFDPGQTGTAVPFRHAVPLLAATKGNIVNISSAAGKYTGMPPQMLSSYSASKAGLNQLTRILATELGPLGIRVNAVSPGVTETEICEKVFEDRALIERCIAATPLGRTAVAEDIAPMVCFLASEEAAWVTGQIVDATGGYHLAL